MIITSHSTAASPVLKQVPPPLGLTPPLRRDFDAIIQLISWPIVELMMKLYWQFSVLRECGQTAPPATHAEAADNIRMLVDEILERLLKAFDFTGPADDRWRVSFDRIKTISQHQEIIGALNEIIDRDKRQAMRLAVCLWHLRSVEGVIMKRTDSLALTPAIYQQCDEVLRIFAKRFIVEQK